MSQVQRRQFLIAVGACSLSAWLPKAHSCMSRSMLVLLLVLAVMGTTTTIADENSEDRWGTYEYPTDVANAAAEKHLDLQLAPFRLAGKLNRNTPEFERVQKLFAQLVEVAMHKSDFAKKLDWALYLYEGPNPESFSRAGGKVVISTSFLDRYRPIDAELAFVLGHEIAHVLCEHERMNLSAAWHRNAPYRLPASYAMEYLDTEALVRAQLASDVRLQERVADRVGLELAAAAGVDPISALGFFDKSANADRGANLYPDAHDLPVERKFLLLQTAESFRSIFAMIRGHEVSCAL
jgi:Zn-dependent protease with chaperone function